MDSSAQLAHARANCMPKIGTPNLKPMTKPQGLQPVGSFLPLPTKLAVGQKIGTQNGSLVNGTKDYNLWSPGLILTHTHSSCFPPVFCFEGSRQVPERTI